MDDPRADDAWSRRERIYVKALADGKVMRINRLADLQLLPPVTDSSTPINPRQRRKQKAAARQQAMDHDPPSPGDHQLSSSYRDRLVGDGSARQACDNDHNGNDNDHNTVPKKVA
ncbi:hypothetical protein BaRGS_00024028 [Batillaria attramentaria]|uniref:Uncharacterized protein n=1 Tax=Batillaria attramentaria TaxID=370345 RepID=A0ABD0KCC7_9CAEN